MELSIDARVVNEAGGVASRDRAPCSDAVQDRFGLSRVDATVIVLLEGGLLFGAACGRRGRAWKVRRRFALPLYENVPDRRVQAPKQHRRQTPDLIGRFRIRIDCSARPVRAGFARLGQPAPVMR